ncbi:MAG: helix-turn-helix domain-containing protein [Verrucomicrobia bacterium]|nr:helix-turn-helix domain-containing protein [Verrucomicrobiota bacterium]
MNGLLTKKQLRQAKAYYAHVPPADAEIDPRVEQLVNDLIGRVADKWTMLLLELLAEQGEMRFTRIADAIGGISQKMLTQTLRQMEREGLVTRTIHPVIPPRVEYKLTKLGLSLGEAFCGVWVWAAEHLDEIERSRRAFDARAAKAPSPARRA